MTFLSVVELGFLILLMTKTQLSNMFQLANPGVSPVNPAAHHLGYFVPVSMHQYAYIELIGKWGLLSFKKNLVSLKLLASFVHIKKFKYRPGRETEDKKLSGLGFISLMS